LRSGCGAAGGQGAEEINPAIRPMIPGKAKISCDSTQLAWGIKTIGLSGYIKKNYGCVGFGYSSINYDNQDQIDENDNKIGTVINKDTLVSLNYARNIVDDVSFGVNFKFADRHLGTFSGSGMAADLGIYGKISDNFETGLIWQNLNIMKIRLADEMDNFPSRLVLGARLRFLNQGSLKCWLMSDTGFSFYQRYNDLFLIGFETEIENTITIRAGRNNSLEGAFNMGLGIKFKDINIDYAIMNHDMGGSSYVSISYKFTDKEKEDDVQ
jgi:hypothetical protein